MSLFLQTLVLRGILFREQEHRQERIGVAMTLWPTGRNDEKKRMKSRLATYMNLGARILASSLLAVIVTAAAGAQSASAGLTAGALCAPAAAVTITASNEEARMRAPRFM